MSKNVDFDSHCKRQQDVASSEFIHDLLNRLSGLNNARFVDELLPTLGRTNLRDSLVNALNAGTKTRAQLLQEHFFTILDAEGTDIGLYRRSHSIVHEKGSPILTEVLSVEFERKQKIRSTPPVPPIDAEFILHIFLKTDELDAVVGDLLEKYEKMWKRFGPRRAKLWFYSEVLRSLWPLLKRFIAKAGGLLALGEWLRRHVS